ncbi:thioesterase II family protein [Streptomyces sp. bgisy126]|uniref:thioesterase II family protein n=1 Tax=unclassified Streptomyces TaxID=2593676 RepID=UPI003EBC5C50
MTSFPDPASAPAPEDVVWDLPGDAPHRLSLLVLPHAGGNAHAYSAWREHLPADVRLLIGQYPGRGARYSENLPESVDDLALPVVDALPSDTGPLVVLGHSMGSLVAFEVTRALQAGGRTPYGLIASACRAPVLPNQCPVHPERFDDDQLVAAIKERGGTDDGILDDPELREIVLPSIRADFAIDDVYRCTAPDVRLDCPVAVFGGDADPIVPTDMLGGWSLVAGHPVEPEVLPGDHFYFQQDLPGFFARLNSVLGALHGSATTAA